MGERRGRGLGSTAAPEGISSLDQDLLWSGATESRGTGQLPAPASSRRGWAATGVCKAMLHSWEAVRAREEETWRTCCAMRVSELSLCPSTGAALPSPAARAQPRPR